MLLKNPLPKSEKNIFKNEEEILKQIQDIMQPLPGKKAETLTITDLPKLIEKRSGIKNTARNTLKFNDTSGFRKLIGEEGPDGFFRVGDYEITAGGKMDNFLKNIEKLN